MAPKALALAAVAMVGAAPASAATEPLTAVMEFDATGTFSATDGAGTDTPEHADVALKWSQTYAGDLQPDGSITFQATGAGAPGAAPPASYRPFPRPRRSPQSPSSGNSRPRALAEAR